MRCAAIGAAVVMSVALVAACTPSRSAAQRLTDHRARPSSTDPAASSPTHASNTPPNEDYAGAYRGLLRLLAVHRRSATHPTVTLTTCPYGAPVALAATALRAAHIDPSRGATTAGVGDWRDGDGNGDGGGSVECSVSGSLKFHVTAFSHSRAVPHRPKDGWQGPEPFRGGRLYETHTSRDGRSCGAYWTPSSAQTRYVLAVQFRAPHRVPTAACGNALRAIHPQLIGHLAAAAR